MGKIPMSKVDKESVLNMLISNENSVKIPQAVEVVNYQTGEFDRGGEKGLMYWANLSVVDVEELELLKSVGLEGSVAKFENQTRPL